MTFPPDARAGVALWEDENGKLCVQAHGTDHVRNTRLLLEAWINSQMNLLVSGLVATIGMVGQDRPEDGGPPEDAVIDRR